MNRETILQIALKEGEWIDDNFSKIDAIGFTTEELERFARRMMAEGVKAAAAGLREAAKLDLDSKEYDIQAAEVLEDIAEQLEKGLSNAS